MITSLEREIIKQLFKISITKGKEISINDFELYIDNQMLKKSLDDLFSKKLVEKGEDENNYKLTELGRSKITVVLTGGAYDLLHTGHIKTLKEASAYGDFLLVVVAKDTTVEGRKRRPIHSEDQRMNLLNELKVVDLAVIGDKTDHMAIVRTVRPDIIAIGSDQDHRIKSLENQIVDQGLPMTKIMRLTSNLEGMSTTEVISEILERFV